LFLFDIEKNSIYVYTINKNFNIDEQAEGAIILDGFDDAIVGIVEEFGNSPRILYSKNKIIYTLQDRDGMSWSEAEEFYDFNILGLYAGEQNPVFLITE